MTNESIQPYTGLIMIDLTTLAPFLIDLPPGALRGLRREQPGMAGVLVELESGIPVLGAKAAISPDVYASFEKTHSLILEIRAARLIVDKLAEVLAESEVYYEDQRESDITLMATAVRTSARHKDESIRAAFEKTLTYNAQVAMKAVRTRRKNAAAKIEAAAEARAEPPREADAPGEAPAPTQPTKAPVMTP